MSLVVQVVVRYSTIPFDATQAELKFPVKVPTTVFAAFVIATPPENRLDDPQIWLADSNGTLVLSRASGIVPEMADAFRLVNENPFP